MDAMIAARAYGAAIKQAQGVSSENQASEAQGVSFGNMVQSALSQTVQSTQQAESMVVANMEGRAELIDAVTAISSAETNLQTVIAIRDQVISAYQEIMRMPI